MIKLIIELLKPKWWLISDFYGTLHIEKGRFWPNYPYNYVILGKFDNEKDCLNYCNWIENANDN